MERTKILALTWGCTQVIGFIYTCLLWDYAGDVSGGRAFEPVWMGICMFGFAILSFFVLFKEEFRGGENATLGYGIMLGYLFMLWNSAFIYMVSGELKSHHTAALSFAWFYWLSASALGTMLLLWRKEVFELQSGPQFDDSVYQTYGDSQFGSNNVDSGSSDNRFF